MKVGDTVEAIALFFNDFIGSFVPGLALTAGFCAIHLGPEKCVAIAKALDSGFLVLIAIGLLFAIGHGLLALYEHALQKALIRFRVTGKFNQAKATGRSSYTSFREFVEQKEREHTHEMPTPATWGYHDLRNAAMSVSAEGAALGRRFMFISLLCNGVGTVTVIMIIDFAICLAFAPSLLHLYTNAAPWPVQMVLMVVFSWALFKRGESFHSRAMTTPFASAVAEIKLLSTHQ